MLKAIVDGLSDKLVRFSSVHAFSSLRSPFASALSISCTIQDVPRKKRIYERARLLNITLAARISREPFKFLARSRLFDARTAPHVNGFLRCNISAGHPAWQEISLLFIRMSCGSADEQERNLNIVRASDPRRKRDEFQRFRAGLFLTPLTVAFLGIVVESKNTRFEC